LAIRRRKEKTKKPEKKKKVFTEIFDHALAVRVKKLSH